MSDIAWSELMYKHLPRSIPCISCLSADVGCNPSTKIIGDAMISRSVLSETGFAVKKKRV